MYGKHLDKRPRTIAVENSLGKETPSAAGVSNCFTMLATWNNAVVGKKKWRWIENGRHC
jgi:hypothetical protein